ncbi:RagB/SusD family nutrient uptake outer membrane protein [Sphingobacterium thalpophilum]|uniref:RagB/SusD family nutrient uptake outer membrane protein n=1 Tax=Sphingobacterium thalpophilum TaxID=259 RepID=UPI003DA4AC9E
MKIKINILTIGMAVSAVLTIVGCSKFLDVVPSEFHKEENVFEDIKQAEKEVTKLYDNLPIYFDANGGSNNILSPSSDETYHNWDQSNARLYEQGAWNPVTNPLGNWEETYQNVRIAYHFLENIDQVPVLNDAQRERYLTVVIPRYKCEVKFLLAFYYFELFKRYGAVPLIDRHYSVLDMDEVLRKDRRPVDEVVNFIVKLCDEAASGLPLSYEDDLSEYGRATKGAALALKAKTLLYAASPLFNGGELDGEGITVNGQDVKTTLLAVKNSDGTALFPQQYDKEKWKKAADAAKEVIDLGMYSLHSIQQELFYIRNRTEVIWHKQIGSRTAGSWDAKLMPNGTDYGSQGSLSVTNAFVDSYEMKNGLPIDDPRSGYVRDAWTDTTMNVFRNQKWQKVDVRIRSLYHNRDPRMYTDIYFNGQPLLHRNVITEYVTNLGNNNDGWGGKTGQNTRTGYYVQKTVAPTQDPKNKAISNMRNGIYIRLAEVYLWYAEAMNEYLDAPSQDVYVAINQVRKRVGMPELPISSRAEDLTKAGMRTRIRNERKIELFTEGHRFFDIRRWLIAHTDECTELIGLNINASGESFYKPTAFKNGKRVFTINHYLMPLPTAEVMKAPGVLIQNYGW